MITFNMKLGEEINLSFDEESGYSVRVEKVVQLTYNMEILDSKDEVVDSICFTIFTEQALNDYLDASYSEFLTYGNLRGLE